MAFNPKIHEKLHKNFKTMTKKDKLYGTTIIGARGQIVIPAEARKDLNLNTGDHLLVMGKLGKVLGLMKADQMQELVTMIMEDLAGTVMEKEAKTYIDKFFGKLNFKK